MFENIEKLVKKLGKLEDYYVLRQEKDHVIVGTKIIIKEHKEFFGNVFQPRTQNISKELPVFFLITIAKKPLEIDKMFLTNKLPFLSMNKYKEISTLKDLEGVLAGFVTNNFEY